VPADQSAQDGQAGGIGVGTGKGVAIGNGNGTDPGATAKGGGGKQGAPNAPPKPPGAPKGGSGNPDANGAPGAKGKGPGGNAGGVPNGVSGGQGTGPLTGGDPSQTGTATEPGGPGGASSGGSTDPRLAPSATGQPPNPNVTKQGKNPNGALDGGTADTGQADQPGDPNANGNVKTGSGGGGDSATETGTGGGPGGAPNGNADGVPGGSANGMPGGGGDMELPWYLASLRYIGRAVQFVGAVAEIIGGIAMLAAPEPTITKVGGVILLAHGLDSLVSVFTGGRTLTARSTTYVAKHVFHASDKNARLAGDLADIAVPLIAGGMGALGKTGKFGAVKPQWDWTKKIPGAGWYMRGSAVDAELQALSKSDRALYELGQRTLSNSAFGKMSTALGEALLQSVVAGARRRPLMVGVAGQAASSWSRSLRNCAASARADAPRPKARSTMRASPRMSRVTLKADACPLRSARITSKPLIVA
jgi:hypothetical protein